LCAADGEADPPPCALGGSCRFTAIALAVVTLAAAGCTRGPAPPDPSSFAALDPAVRTLLDELIAGVDEDRSDAARWGRLGMGFEANGLLVEAASAYQTAVSLDDREPRWRYRLAVLRARRGDREAALADLERVIAVAPGYVPARWRRGLWLLDRGDVAEAEASFRVAVQAAPHDPAGHIGLALVHLSTGKNAEAASVLEALLAQAPGERYARHLLGTAYSRLGRDDEARAALTIGAAGEPVWVDPWTDEVSTYRRGFAVMLKEATALGLERQFDKAIAILRQLCELKPDDTALKVYLGGMYASAGRLAEAEETLGPILAADPTQFDAEMHLASGYLFTGALDKAAAHASRALALRPASADAAKLEGMVLWQQGRARDAAMRFQAAADADPRDPMPHLWIGMMLGQQGQYLDARRRFEAALSKNPLLGDALIGLADTFAATGAFDQAQAALERAQQAEPGNPRLAAARERITAAAGTRR
jgi:tetratricopeptide (TPR) repeat protein